MSIPSYPVDSPELTTNVPVKLGGNGKVFEDSLLASAKRMKKCLTMGRYGVSVSLIAGEWRPVPSKPDFDGSFMGGKQFNVEAKVCSKPSFGLGPESFKESQYAWMKTKSSYGVECYLVIHFNARSGKTFSLPALTVSIPVHPDLPHWQAYERGELRSISPDYAKEIGTVIPWTVPKGSRKPLPHFI